MKINPFFFACFLAGGWCAGSARAQIYVTPKMGGGQVAADMVHIDLYYDDVANQFHAHIDTSFGTPELRALEPGYAFDSHSNYAVLSGKAYNSQYGWNAGGFFTIPAGAAIWIQQTNSSPGLEVYQDWGRLGSYSNIFGTGGSSRLWKWSGVMVHNTYAFLYPATNRLFADYLVYFGDATTGSRSNFVQYGSTNVHLEWTTVPVENPLTFKFGAAGVTNGAPLLFLNATSFMASTETVIHLQPTNAPPCSWFECNLPLLAVPATAINGGPATNHAALGSRLELQFVSLTGPCGASLSCWEAGETQPCFNVPVGQTAGTNRIGLSSGNGTPASDPFGRITGRRFGAAQAGLYCLGFRVLDTSTNGTGGGPIHAPSSLYRVYFQAGTTVEILAKQGSSVTATFGGEINRNFYLERSPVLGPSAPWQTVAGPLPGADRLQRLSDPSSPARAFYRLRIETP